MAPVTGVADTGDGIIIIITIRTMDGEAVTGEVVMVDGLDLIPIIMIEITFMAAVEDQV